MTDIKDGEVEIKSEELLSTETEAAESRADTSAQNEDEGERRSRDPREEAVRNWRAQRDAERGKPEAEDEDEPAKSAPASADETEDEPAKTAEPTEEYELTVYGRKEKVDRDELIRRAQKTSAAEIRLREADAMIAQLRSQIEATAAKPAKTEAPAETKDKPAAPAALSDSEAAELARAIQIGDEEESRAAIKTIYQRAIEQAQALAQTGREPEHDPGATLEDVDKHLEKRFQIERERSLLENDLQTFGAEYPDIVGDQRLTQVAVTEAHRLRAEDLIASGQYTEDSVHKLEQLARTDAAYAQHLAMLHRDLEQRGLATRRIDLFRRAGDATRAWRNPAPSQEETQKDALADTTAQKKADKAALPKQPKAATKRGEIKAPPSRPQRMTAYARSLMRERGTLVTRN